MRGKFFYNSIYCQLRPALPLELRVIRRQDMTSGSGHVLGIVYSVIESWYIIYIPRVY